MEKSPLITAEKLSFQYHNQEQYALSQINLEIHPNKFILVCGPTGSGKSSLFRSLNGLIPHFYHGKFYGYVKINSEDSLGLTPAKISKTLGSVFQNPENQLFSMTVERELSFALQNFQFSKEEIKNRVSNAVKMTHISSLLQRAPYELSGGEQQKVAIAALISLDPEILVLDEPLANLDPKSAFEIISLLRELKNKHQKTILISEHRLEYLLPVIDEAILIKNGKIVTYSSFQQILDMDEFYELDLDIPELILFLHKLKKRGLFTDAIPLDSHSQNRILTKLLKDKNPFEIESFPIPTSNQEIIHLEDVSFQYDGTEHPALKNINLSVFKGEIIGILGPNGAGKSTLMRLLNGLLKPTNGLVSIKNMDTRITPVNILTKMVGLMFQNPDHQLFATNLIEELDFSLKNLHLSKNETTTRIEDIIQKLELEPLKDQSPFNVSGGQKKKIALATILCRNCDIIVFDEPTVGQDRRQKRNMTKIIKEESLRGKTILIITHDLDFISNIASRLIIMKEGQILTEGSPQELLTNKNIIQQAFLCESLVCNLFEALHEEIPWVPEKALSIKMLEDLLDVA